MIKKAFFLLLLSFAAITASAQDGGVTGRVVNRAGRVPVAGATVILHHAGTKVGQMSSSADGSFLFKGLEDGLYQLVVSAEGYNDVKVNAVVEKVVKDLMFVSLVSAEASNDLDDSSFAEFDMDDSGYQDRPSILFSSNDVFSNVAGYTFSSVRFLNRGLRGESQDLYLAGVKMNDAITGYSAYSLWTGLNEAVRSQETVIGSEVSDYGFGTYNGLTNIIATPSAMRGGSRFSILSNSAFYRLRLMASYATGQLDNGWSFAANASVRLGGNDWVRGVYYRSFAWYLGAEKQLNDSNKLSFVALASPGQRGAQNGSTQEVYDLMGDNMYNSNWGWQKGKIRNARVRKTNEPVFFIKHAFTPSDKLESTTTLLWRTGRNGYTSLDWYNAADPRPDYYRNLPSYYYNENPDYGRTSPMKAAWQYEAWTCNYASTCHIDWDRLYNVNYRNVDSEGKSRSKYIIEERRTDQNDIHLSNHTKYYVNRNLTVLGGAEIRWNRTRNYKIVDDLLGGDYYVNVDQFAEREYASNPGMIQNDLEYYMANGHAQILGEGDIFGYNYIANVHDANLWLSARYENGGFSAFAAGEVNYTALWREGLYRKGLFAGLDKNGQEYICNGEVITSYDSNGNPISSLGKSDVLTFMSYAAKGGLSYYFDGGVKIDLNGGWFNEAPKFNQVFVSPRTRNTVVPILENSKTLSIESNLWVNKGGFDMRLTGFYTKIMDQTDVMSFYDDEQKSFTNFAMSGIDERHAGIELGFRIPTPVSGLNIQGAVSYGDYIYTSTPRMTQTIDNSAEIVYDNVLVPFWTAHNEYKKVVDGDGNIAYLTNSDGSYIVDKTIRHHVSSSPEFASTLGLNWRTSSYWFINLNANYFANTYLDMNPLYRTDAAVCGPDKSWSPAEEEYMAAQEKFNPAMVVNASIGKSWYLHRKYNFGFSLEFNNLLNNKNVRTGGYEQTRLITGKSGERYYRFDPKYYYMQGFNYMLNLYFRF